jgi:hypothetical protein
MEEAARLKPQDALCTHFLQVIQKLADNPPGPDWDGVTTMTDK